METLRWFFYAVLALIAGLLLLGAQIYMSTQGYHGGIIVYGLDGFTILFYAGYVIAAVCCAGSLGLALYSTRNI